MKKPTREIRKILNPNRKEPKQLEFAFNIQDEEGAELENFIQEQADDETIPNLERVIHHFSQPPHEWHAWQTVTVTARLVAYRAILLKTFGKVLNFSECAQRLLDQDAWGEVYVFLQGVPDDESLSRQTPALSKRSSAIFLNAEPLIRKKLEKWRERLIDIRSKAGEGQVRLGKRVFEARVLLDELLRINDPVELMKRFQDVRAQLADLDDYLSDMDAFYETCLAKWFALLAALDRVAPNRLEFRKDPEAAALLQKMDEISKSAKPFELMDDVDELIAAVDRKSASLVAEYREFAMDRIDQLIAAVMAKIRKHEPASELSNQTLYPLRAAKKHLLAENRLSKIRDQLQDAEDHADEMLERITINR